MLFQEYTQELRATNRLTDSVATAQAATEAKSLAALHELDMIAGGKAKNVAGMGDARVNSSIGASWRSRVDGMDKHAGDRIANGEKTMNVKLKRC